MTRFVATHVLAKDLTEEGILDALGNGRAYVGFDMIADARGFIYVAEGHGEKLVMGDERTYADGYMLKAASPLPCRFTLVRDGETVTQSDGRTFSHDVEGPGVYRIEAELDIRGEWTPWVYTNPIYFRAPSTNLASRQ
jgi:hypothetical protein